MTLPSLGDLRSRLMKSDEYIASPTTIAAHNWRNKAGGHLISGGTGVLCVVGRVVDNKFDVANAGNWRTYYKEGVEKAKWCIMLEKADGTVFAQDWAPGVAAARKMQLSICDGLRARNFVFEDRAGTLLRFTAGVFEKKNENDPEGFDPSTWFVPDEMRDAFDAALEKHHLTPILVFDADGAVVDPHTLNERLMGALVEITYEFKHWEMKGADGKPFDTFTGHIVQVVIHQEAKKTGGNSRGTPVPFRAGPSKVASAPPSGVAAAHPRGPTAHSAARKPTGVTAPPTLQASPAAPPAPPAPEQDDNATGHGPLPPHALSSQHPQMPATPPRTPAGAGAFSPTPYSPATPAGFYQAGPPPIAWNGPQSPSAQMLRNGPPTGQRIKVIMAGDTAQTPPNPAQGLGPAISSEAPAGPSSGANSGGVASNAAAGAAAGSPSNGKKRAAPDDSAPLDGAKKRKEDA